MTVDYMRMKLQNDSIYKSPTWIDRVRHMSDRQVIAVYHKFQETGQFNKKKRRANKNEPTYEQMTIFDFI